MSNLTSNLSHIVVALAVIGAVTALAAIGTISGAEALVVIAAVSGVSVGGGVASSAASSPAPGTTTVSVPAQSGSRSNGVTIMSAQGPTEPAAQA